jgi:hypothetical protein
MTLAAYDLGLWPLLGTFVVQTQGQVGPWVCTDN